MIKSLTLPFFAVLICGCAATGPADQAVSMDRLFAGPSVQAHPVSVADETALRHERGADVCVSSEESESGRSRCH